jgi:hypothetical protein
MNWQFPVMAVFHVSTRLRLNRVEDFCHYLIVDRYIDHQHVGYDYIHNSHIVWC